jgi:hypothetical protein
VIDGNAGALDWAPLNPLWRSVVVVKILLLMIVLVIVVIALCGCDVEPRKERPIPRPENPVLDAPILKTSR